MEIPETLQQNAGYLLNRTARIIRERISEALAPLKLAPRDVGTLRLLSDEGPMSQLALGSRHNIDRTTVVAVIDALERRELVVRVTNPKDRRSHLIHLTPRGRKTLAQAAKIVQTEQEKFLAPLGVGEWEQVRQALLKLLAAQDKIPT